MGGSLIESSSQNVGIQDVIGLDLYSACSAEQINTTYSMVQCMRDYVAESQHGRLSLIDKNESKSRNMQILVAAFIVFFMQAGFAMVCAGGKRTCIAP